MIIGLLREIKNNGFRVGLNCCDGKCTYPGVAEALGLKCVAPATLL